MMFHVGELSVLCLASLWLVQGQPGTVRTAEYDALRNNSQGPILCATDEPQLVLTDASSRLHCSVMCLQNNQCLSFNYKDISCRCEHFHGYPYKYTVDPDCRHYAVRADLRS